MNKLCPRMAAARSPFPHVDPALCDGFATMNMLEPIFRMPVCLASVKTRATRRRSGSARARKPVTQLVTTTTVSARLRATTSERHSVPTCTKRTQSDRPRRNRFEWRTEGRTAKTGQRRAADYERLSQWPPCRRVALRSSITARFIVLKLAPRLRLPGLLAGHARTRRTRIGCSDPQYVSSCLGERAAAGDVPKVLAALTCAM
jgi:hypothetical protein